MQGIKTRILKGLVGKFSNGVTKMIKVIDLWGNVHNVYGTFPNEDGSIRFVFRDNNGAFYAVDNGIEEYFKLFKEDK